MFLYLSNPISGIALGISTTFSSLLCKRSWLPVNWVLLESGFFIVIKWSMTGFCKYVRSLWWICWSKCVCSWKGEVPWGGSWMVGSCVALPLCKLVSFSISCDGMVSVQVRPSKKKITCEIDSISCSSSSRFPPLEKVVLGVVLL